jgi:iron complex transport system substrate-binding protein
MIMPHRALRVAVLPLAMLLVASVAGTSLAQERATVVDADGNNVVIEDASRVVTLGGVATEIAYALGAQDQIVAIDESSYYPPEAIAEKSTIGYHRFLAAEPVLAADPTLIIGDDTTGPPDVVSQLREAGITMLLLGEPGSLDDTRETVRSIGLALGLEGPAEEVVATLDEEVAAAEEVVSQVTTTPRVLFFFRPPGAPSLVSGTGTGASEMIALAGGENVFPFFEGYIPMTPEGIAEAAPDLILTTDASLGEFGGLEGLLAEPGIGQTPAAQNGRIVSMEDLYLLGFGPRTGQAIAELAQLLHPDLAQE